jgi:hypothetical protein
MLTWSGAGAAGARLRRSYDRIMSNPGKNAHVAEPPPGRSGTASAGSPSKPARVADMIGNPVAKAAA